MNSDVSFSSKCDYETKAYNYPALDLKDSGKLTVWRAERKTSVNHTGSLLK